MAGEWTFASRRDGLDNRRPVVVGEGAFQESRHVRVDSRVEKKDWWYPYGKDNEPGRRAR
jgi:hypothetical protein